MVGESRLAGGNATRLFAAACEGAEEDIELLADGIEQAPTAVARRFGSNGGAGGSSSVVPAPVSVHGVLERPFLPHIGSLPGKPRGGSCPSYSHWSGGGPAAPIAKHHPVMVRR